MRLVLLELATLGFVLQVLICYGYGSLMTIARHMQGKHKESSFVSSYKPWVGPVLMLFRSVLGDEPEANKRMTFLGF